MVRTKPMVLINVMAMEDRHQAAQIGQEGFEIFQKIGYRWNKCTSLCCLGFAFLGLGDIEKARDYFNMALKQSRENRMMPLSLYALAGLACTMAQEGEAKKAMELFRYVQRPPKTPSNYVKEAARWLVASDRASSPNASAPAALGGEGEAVEEVIDRVLSVQAGHSESSSTSTGRRKSFVA
jgi:tetratricopeptide (TPR) repeat protein